MTAKLLSVKKKNDRNFITVECLLAFDKDEDKDKVLNLMRKFSSMVRFACKRPLEGVKRKELKKMLSQKYGINTRQIAHQVVEIAKREGKAIVAKRKGLVPLPGQGTAAQNMCSFIHFG